MPTQPRRIGFEIRTVHNLIKRNMDSKKPPELNAATGVHGWVIHYFYKNRDHDTFQRDFETHFSIRRSTATQILKLMETNGLITRQPVPYDGRLKKIVLTEKAIEIHNKIDKNMDEMEETLTRGITPEEEDTFYRVLDKIKANLEVDKC